MASIEKRKDADGNVTSYRLIVSMGYNTNGKKVCQKKTVKPPNNVKTELQIKKWLNEQAVLFENAVLNNQYFDGDKMTFGEYALRWFKIAEKTYSPTLLPSLKMRLERRIIPELGHLKLAKLQTHHLDGFFDCLQEENARLDLYYIAVDSLRERLSKLPIGATFKAIGISDKTYARLKSGERTDYKTAVKVCEYFQLDINKSFSITSRAELLSGRTVKHHYDIIRVILTEAKREKLIASNPIDDIRKLKKYKKKEIAYYDDEQIAELFFALDSEPLKYRALCMTAIDTGMRLAEIAGLEWKNVDLENSILKVVQQRQRLTEEYGGEIIIDPKTENGNRSLTLTPTVVNLLKGYKHQQKLDCLMLGIPWENNDFVFRHEDGVPMHPSRPYQWLRRFLAKNNLPHIPFHGLRHTNASLLLAEDVDIATVSGRLGHADKNITLRTYIHIIKSREKQAANKMESVYQNIRNREEGRQVL